MTVVVYLFPGQGIQRPGMGAELFERYPDLVAEADRLLGYSVRRLAMDAREGLLERTRYVQPAVYVVNALAYRALTESASAPDVLLGHSLGEYNALEAAGVFDFATGLRLVRARAEATDGIPGAMLAVVGLRRDALAGVLERRNLAGVVFANLNSELQTVLSGPVHEIEEAHRVLAGQGAKVVTRLRVSGAFHSPHMGPAVPRFADELQRARLDAPDKTVVSNATARPHDPDTLRSRLIEHLTRPVLWQQSVEWVLDMSRRAGREIKFHEVGDNNLLEPLVAHIRQEWETDRRSYTTRRIDARK